MRRSTHIRLVRGLLLLVAFTTAQAAVAGPRAQLAAERTANVHAQEQDLKSTRYGSRSIGAYRAIIGSAFFDRLQALGPKQHFLEVGPGAEPLMIHHYLSLPGAKAKVSTVGMEALRPAEYLFLQRQAAAKGTTYTHHSGEFIEKLPPGRIEPVDLLVDQFAAFHYTGSPEMIVKAEGGLLRMGGVLHTHGAPSTYILDRHGRDVLPEWAGAIKGMKLVNHVRVHEGDAVWHQIGLERTGEEIEAPVLLPLHFKAGHPPQRVFLWTK